STAPPPRLLPELPPLPPPLPPPPNSRPSISLARLMASSKSFLPPPSLLSRHGSRCLPPPGSFQAIALFLSERPRAACAYIPARNARKAKGIAEHLLHEEAAAGLPRWHFRVVDCRIDCR